MSTRPLYYFLGKCQKVRQEAPQAGEILIHYITMKQSILNPNNLQTFAKEHKLQPFRVKQIIQEIYDNQNIRFEDMTTLSKDLRQQLDENFEILSIIPETILESEDNIKIGFKTHDNFTIEAVILFHRSKHEKESIKSKVHKVESQNKGPDDLTTLGPDRPLNRITLCVSSQIGCPVNCVFCVTGKLGIKRDLTRNEIISQLLFANNFIKTKFGKKDDQTLRAVRNVVFMGMGEPLINYQNVKKSIEIMIAQAGGFSLGKRHITISTAGIIPGIEQLIKDDIPVKLAISLHAPNQKLREELMPIAKVYTLDKLMKTIDDYVKVSDNRIFYEYIMIKNKTDKPELATQLADLLHGRLAHVNLIPYNMNPAIKLEESDERTIRAFKDILEKKGITVTIRDSLGRDLKSACGQLGYEKIANRHCEE
ncbi:MAG: 23S rRNA (adenine(2503)-C(2))-methyltransferase RlmN [candidate division SR1 bacterium CG_4_9_14_3_um_filter_40_9]|nr:MAG: 23S rRNA (adenine(2503)-C(2))-methyltransferase RlmN [candidate division SR1 bacterium CG_4_9_14_3_um_filter_40_9]